MRNLKKAPNVLVVLILLWALSANAQGSQAAPPNGRAGASQQDVIASISFSGNKKFTEKQLSEAIAIKVGEPMSPEIIRGAINRLVDFYRKNGANLSVSPNIKPNGGKASVEFMIDENGTKGDAGRFEPGGGPAPPGKSWRVLVRTKGLVKE